MFPNDGMFGGLGDTASPSTGGKFNLGDFLGNVGEFILKLPKEIIDFGQDLQGHINTGVTDLNDRIQPQLQENNFQIAFGQYGGLAIAGLLVGVIILATKK